MRVFRTFFLFAVLGCSFGDDTLIVDPEPPRDTSVPISSSVRFDINKFEGDWFIVSRYPHVEVSKIPIKVDFIDRDRIRVTDESETYYLFRYGGLGRFEGSAFGASQKTWVLWTDEEQQILVWGGPDPDTPSQIWNRSPTIRSDRLQAAKDILQFNGYDLSQLKTVPQ